MSIVDTFKTLPVIILTNQGDVDSMNETKVFGNASDKQVSRQTFSLIKSKCLAILHNIQKK